MADRPIVQQGVTGTVKWFNGTKGFGFISRDDGQGDLFAHNTCIKAPNGQFEGLNDGETVHFDVAEGQKGLQAVNITGPRGGPVQGCQRSGGGGDGGYGGGGGGYGGGRGGGGYGGGGGGYGGGGGGFGRGGGY